MVIQPGTEQRIDSASYDYPAATWEECGLTAPEVAGWIKAGLRDPKLAARCRRSGIPPADLGMPLSVNTPLQRLQQGQSTDDVSKAIEDQLNRWSGERSVKTHLPPDEMAQRAVDRRYGLILGELWDQLCAGLPQTLAIFLDHGTDPGIYVHRIDKRPHLTFLNANEMPSPSSFICQRHASPEKQSITVQSTPSSVRTDVTPTCALGVIQGVRDALYAVSESGYTGTEIGPARLNVSQSRVLSRPVEAKKPTNRSSSRADRPLGHWQGFPVPKACRMVTRAVFEAIDEHVKMSVDSIHQVAQDAQCMAHPQADLAPLLSNTKLFTPSDGTNLRLTLAGQLMADDLARHSKPFRYSSAIHHGNAIYLWQRQALDAWAKHGRFGVIEAVTGTGKTRVGVEATAEAIRDDIKVVVCVPTLVLLEQWYRVLTSAGLRNVGRVGGGEHDTFLNHDVLIGTVQSLSKSQEALRFDGTFMLIADECHRDGAPTFQSALNSKYVRRLGLTATFERSDDRLRDLEAFFESSPVFNIEYTRAVPDGIVAHYVVARVGVDFTREERLEYDEVNETCRSSRGRLISAGLPAEPFGTFMEAAAAAAAGVDDLAMEARRYLDAFSRRAQVLSLAQGKVEAVRALAEVVRASNGALLFTMRVAGAERAAALLNEQGARALAISGISTRDEREQALDALRDGLIDAIAAPRILDEGVDVPEADLAVIIATSSSRLQMIQRMGRVLRLKKDGGRARFVLLYVRGTAEDPTGAGAAHEAFFDAITPTADDVADFALQQEEALCQFLILGASPAAV